MEEVSISCCTTKSAKTISPIFIFFFSAPATPIFIITCGLYFEIIICEQIAALTLPGPHNAITQSVLFIFPEKKFMCAKLSHFVFVKRFMMLSISICIAPIIPIIP